MGRVVSCKYSLQGKVYYELDRTTHNCMQLKVVAIGAHRIQLVANALCEGCEALVRGAYLQDSEKKEDIPCLCNDSP